MAKIIIRYDGLKKRVSKTFGVMTKGRTFEVTAKEARMFLDTRPDLYVLVSGDIKSADDIANEIITIDKHPFTCLSVKNLRMLCKKNNLSVSATDKKLDLVTRLADNDVKPEEWLDGEILRDEPVTDESDD